MSISIFQLKRVKRFHILRQPDGRKLRILLKPRFVDPYPRMFIDDVEVTVAAGMPVVATIWASVPLLYLFVFGCVGGAVGGVATTMNHKLMRSSYSPRVRYALVGLVNVGTFLFFLMLMGMAALRPRP